MPSTREATKQSTQRLPTHQTRRHIASFQRTVASPERRRSLPLPLQDRNCSESEGGDDLDMSVSEFLAEIDERRVCSARQERLRVYSAVQDDLCPPPTRPETAPSRGISSKTTYSHHRSCPHRVPSASRLREPRQCLRANTPDARDGMSPDVLTAAETCQLLGPQVCRFCDSGNRRSRELDRSQSAFHGLEISAENFTSSLLMKKHFPQLTSVQQRELIAKGVVKKNVFLGFLHRCADNHQQRVDAEHRRPKSRAEEETDTISSDDEEKFFLTAQTQVRKRGSRPSLAPDGSSWSYFTNLADLDEKISLGRLPRRLVGDDPEENREMMEESEQKWKLKKRASLLEITNPAFISSRKVNLNIETKMKHYYEPPLLQLEQQRVSNVFFAGQESEYKLAERLPDDLMPPGVSNEVDEYFSKSEYETL